MDGAYCCTASCAYYSYCYLESYKPLPEHRRLHFLVDYTFWLVVDDKFTLAGSLFQWSGDIRNTAETSRTICDAELRVRAHTVHIDLSDTKWLPASDCCAGSSGQALLQAVLHSNRHC